MSDLAAVILWWIILQALGLTVWSLVFRGLRWLPDRGYMFTKPLGLLLVSYLLWLLTSLGIPINTRPGIILIAIITLGLCLWFYRRGRTSSAESLVEWLRTHRWLVLSYETLFLLLYVGWVIFRAYLPEIVSGDKMMDLAFINALGRSTSFPPYDPWLAGYPISYYYFGYLMIALLAKVAGTGIGVTYSLSAAIWLALSGACAFGVVADLILLVRRNQKKAVILFGSLGAIMLVLMGNLEAPLEVARIAGVGTPEFWTWLDIEDLNVPYEPPLPGQPVWPPRTTDLGWWWRASRVIHDYPPDKITPRRAASLGVPPDTDLGFADFIDEFPQFIFLLGDLHAHVTAIPFALVSVALALNLFQAGAAHEATMLWRGSRRPPVPWLYPLSLGALSFLNTWDFPIHVLLLSLAWCLGQWYAGRLNPWKRVEDLLILIVLSTLMYLPYYLASQPQGFGFWPNIFYGTRAPQFFVMFGPFILIGLLFGGQLLFKIKQGGQHAHTAILLKTLGGGIAIIALSVAAASILGIVMFQISAPLREWFTTLVEQINARGITIADHLLWRLSDPWVPLSLAVSLAAIVLLWRARRSSTAQQPEDRAPDFALLLFFTGLILTFSVEVFYITGMEKTRANTGFKFYFQAWILWSVAAAYGAYHLLVSENHLRSRLARSAAGVVVFGSVGLGLFYPALAIPVRIDPSIEPSLNALLVTARSARFTHNTYDAYQAVEWLNQNVSGTPIILEASDDRASYRPARARIASWTGLPGLLGWYWHEVQWRGNDLVQRQRIADINTIYSTTDSAEALDLLKKNNVSYVYVGHNERVQYPADRLAKFDQVLQKVFEHGEAVIYQVP